MAADAKKPDFGDKVLIFNPSMSAADIQAQIDKSYAIQQHSEFGPDRYALVFLPGKYNVDVPIGFYTEVIGLGATPDAVTSRATSMPTPAEPRDKRHLHFCARRRRLFRHPHRCTMQWAPSPGAPFRRMHILGDIVCIRIAAGQRRWDLDSLIDGNVGSGTQQQWFSRNSEWGSWTGSTGTWSSSASPIRPRANGPHRRTPKWPSLPLCARNRFLQWIRTATIASAFPSLRTNSAGITWHGGSTPGRSIPIARFYIAHPGQDSAAPSMPSYRTAKNLIFAPGTTTWRSPSA